MKHEIKTLAKILRNYKNEVSQQPYAGVRTGVRGGRRASTALYLIWLPFIPFSILSIIILCLELLLVTRSFLSYDKLQISTVFATCEDYLA